MATKAELTEKLKAKDKELTEKNMSLLVAEHEIQRARTDVEREKSNSRLREDKLAAIRSNIVAALETAYCVKLTSEAASDPRYEVRFLYYLHGLSGPVGDIPPF